jgi:hypothetical protein
MRWIIALAKEKVKNIATGSEDPSGAAHAVLRRVQSIGPRWASLEDAVIKTIGEEEAERGNDAEDAEKKIECMVVASSMALLIATVRHMYACM